jgi:hypothetical protein
MSPYSPIPLYSPIPYAKTLGAFSSAPSSPLASGVATSAPKANAAAYTKQGVAITYSQSTGLTSILHAGGAELPLGVGYAGHGAGKNNPDNQYVQGENAGPPPQGMYEIGSMKDYTIQTGLHRGEKLTDVMTLTPEQGTYMGNPPRNGLLMHGGDFETQGSSTGCEVLPLNVRHSISGSGIREEDVTQ